MLINVDVNSVAASRNGAGAGSAKSEYHYSYRDTEEEDVKGHAERYERGVYEAESVVNSRGSPTRSSAWPSNEHMHGVKSDSDNDSQDGQLTTGSPTRGPSRCYMCRKPNPQ
jgi:hypothetical protein